MVSHQDDISTTTFVLGLVDIRNPRGWKRHADEGLDWEISLSAWVSEVVERVSFLKLRLRFQNLHMRCEMKVE